MAILYVFQVLIGVYSGSVVGNNGPYNDSENRKAFSIPLIFVFGISIACWNIFGFIHGILSFITFVVTATITSALKNQY